MPQATGQQQQSSLPILFFDGVCILCNGFVDFLIRHDEKQQYCFAPLQGKTARSSLDPGYYESLNTIVLKTQNKTLTKSSAALTALSSLGGFFALWQLGFVLPRFFRDAIYDIIATRRYRWFGQRETCRLPDEDERQRILP